jgi:RNA polymerase sigma-70 factor (ECF subfamily)
MAGAQPDPANAESPEFESIEALFFALEAPLLGYALRLTKNSETAEDLVQEAFLRLQTRFADVREPRHWLYRTVHNMAINHQRRAGRTVSLEPASSEEAPVHDPADPQPLPDEHIARLEGIGLVRLGLESLDPRSRELVRMKFREDLSYKEMSKRTGLKIGHVGYLLHHALKSLASELTKAGILP